MTVIELAKLVAECRRAQAIYARDRTLYDQNRARRLEAQVDRAVRAVLVGGQAQAGLFDGEDRA